MESFIKKIIALEQKGKDVVSLARNRQENIDNEIDEGNKQIEAVLTEQVNARLQEIQIIESEEARDRVEAINLESEKNLAEIRKRFEQNKKNWEDELFKKIIGR